ncbi:MAG: hypothetical protein FXF54_01340 [Kosmotoga sp.]|nr:MAG: hypothetical protein FXF54_01340 [Kosmotoga sp.]
MKKTILYVLIVVVLIMLAGCPTLINPFDLPDDPLIANEGEPFTLDLTKYTDAVNINDVIYEVTSGVGATEDKEYVWDKPKFNEETDGVEKVTIEANNNRGRVVSDTFTIIVNRPPSTPTLIEPDDGETVNLPVELEWNSSDPDNDELKFHVYFGTDGNVNQKQSNITVEHYEIDDLDQEDTYYWFIVAEDEHSAKATSDTCSFIYNTTPKNNLKLNLIGEGKVFIEINNKIISTEEPTTVSHEAATVTLTPKSINNNYIFGEWDIDKSHDIIADDVAIFYLDEDVNATATFKLKEYDITLSASPQDGGVVSGGDSFEHGQEVTVVATPNEGYEFSSWTDSKDDTVLSTNPTYTFTATEDKDLIANFDKKTYILTIDKSGEGETEPATGVYGEENEEPWTETLIATPTGDYEFKHWKLSTGETIEATTTEIEINEDITATAIFELPKFEITASASPSEGGIVSGDGSYELGSDVTIVATSNENWAFTGWYEDDDLVNTNTSFTFNATENRDFIAYFRSTKLTIDSTPLSGIPILVNGKEVMTPYSTSVNSGDSIEVTASTTLMLNLENEEELGEYSHFIDEDDTKMIFIKWADNSNSNTRIFDGNNNDSYSIEYEVKYLMKTETWPEQADVDDSATNIVFPDRNWYEYEHKITLRVPYETKVKDSGDDVTLKYWEVNGEKKDTIDPIEINGEQYGECEIVIDGPKFIHAHYDGC